jgi:hypothetical protein
MKLVNRVLILIRGISITACTKPKAFTESDIHIIPKPVGKIFIDTIKFLKGIFPIIIGEMVKRMFLIH